jgi:hypothetical protein
MKNRLASHENSFKARQSLYSHKSNSRRKWFVVLTIFLVVIGFIGILKVTSSKESSNFETAKTSLNSSLQQSFKEGYTTSDLTPIAAQISSLNAPSFPLALNWDQFYKDEVTKTQKLQIQLNDKKKVTVQIPQGQGVTPKPETLRHLQ